MGLSLPLIDSEVNELSVACQLSVSLTSVNCEPVKLLPSESNFCTANPSSLFVIVKLFPQLSS